MIALSPMRYSTEDEMEGEMESFLIGGDEFPDFSGGSLLESIDFDDLFVGIDDGDLLPDLEMDSEMFSEFSSSGGEEMEAEKVDNTKKEEEGKVLGLEFGLSTQGEEIVSKREESSCVNPSKKGGDKGRKSSAGSKNSQGKRKVKVDWTPDLHRRFVQAVEQLGVDKAVPSRILEIMEIDRLTRHNIASHLQKYRLHRKYLLAREAETSNWRQKRQIYWGDSRCGSKNSMSSWLAPTMGFPQNPMTPLQHFRPLHVWGHPVTDQPLMHMWPKIFVPPPTPPPSAAATLAPTLHPPLARLPPPPNPSFWHSHNQKRFPAVPLVPGTPPPHAMYRVDPGAIAVPATQTGHYPPLFLAFQPTEESINSAIGDILSKPCQTLPLGLKPPSLASVMVELQRQGISKVPPHYA